MQGIGDGIVVFLCAMALIYGLYVMITKKRPLFFRLSLYVVACLMLGYIFDICDYIINGVLADGYLIGYLGSLGSVLFLLAASIGYLDGILDDRTPKMRKHRWIALVAPALVGALWIPNFLASIPVATKVVYTVLWIAAMFSSYFNLKHAILPDMDYGFTKAIRPYHIAALSFTFLQLIHLTLWNYTDWIPLMISGTVFGSSAIVMVVMADKGVEKWMT